MDNTDSFDDLHKAMAGFLICLGSTLPRELAEKISSRMVALSEEMESNGEPNVSMLTKGFSEALLRMHNQPKH